MAPGKSKLSLVKTQWESCSISHSYCRDIHITMLKGGSSSGGHPSAVLSINKENFKMKQE